MIKRSWDILKYDILDIPKSMLAGVFGAVILTAGARWGGMPFSTNAINLIQAKVITD